MNFCSRCGEGVGLEVPRGDDRPRYVCGACGAIHYQNPKVVAGCIPEWEDSILICRRAIAPREGLWTLPAGFMENGETTGEAAARETLEEANARVDALSLYAVFDIPHISQVYMVFRGRLDAPEFHAGPESLEVCLATEPEVPWEALAFPVMERVLRLYFEDRRRGEFPVHTGTIRRRLPGGRAPVTG